MNKLKSTSGASIFIALLFFLICTVVGVLILTGATANAGRLARERVEQESYLAVSSAAQLLRDDFAEIVIDIVYTRTDHRWTPGDYEIGQRSAPDFSGSSGGYLHDIVRRMAEAIYSGDSGYVDQTATLTIDAGSDYEVTAELTMYRSNYSIVAVLYTIVDGVPTNVMTLTSGTSNRLIPADDGLFYQDPDNPIISKLENNEDNEIIVHEIIPMKFGTTATWPADKSTITKGRAA